MALGCLGATCHCSSIKSSAPSASWALRNRGGHCHKADLAAVGAVRWGESQGTKGRSRPASGLPLGRAGMCAVVWFTWSPGERVT